MTSNMSRKTASHSEEISPGYCVVVEIIDTSGRSNKTGSCLITRVIRSADPSSPLHLFRYLLVKFIAAVMRGG